MESTTLPLEGSLAPLLNNPLVLTYTLVMSLMLLSLLRVSAFICLPVICPVRVRRGRHVAPAPAGKRAQRLLAHTGGWQRL